MVARAESARARGEGIALCIGRYGISDGADGGCTNRKPPLVMRLISEDESGIEVVAGVRGGGRRCGVNSVVWRAVDQLIAGRAVGVVRRRKKVDRLCSGVVMGTRESARMGVGARLR